MLLDKGLRTLTTRVHNPVIKRIRREQTYFNLDGRDGMDGMGLANRIRTDFTQSDTADFALLDQFGQGRDRSLDRDVGVTTRTLKDVDGLGAAQYLDGLLDRRADTFRATVGPCLDIVGAFDAQYDLVGVLGILFEIVLEEMQRVRLRRAVMYALHANQSTFPKDSLFLKSLQAEREPFYTDAALTPFQKLAPCSRAVFMTFAAMG